MNIATESSIVRQVHLLKLEGFCRGLGEVLYRGGAGRAETLEALRSSVSAQCVLCGIEVAGEELFALSEPAAGEEAGTKLGRLRLGDCARKGCDSFYYQVIFRRHPEQRCAGISARSDVRSTPGTGGQLRFDSEEGGPLALQPLGVNSGVAADRNVRAPKVDWARLLAGVEGGNAEMGAPGASGFGWPEMARELRRLCCSRPIWVAAGALVLVVLIHQWRSGGRIPLIREPEHFHVDQAAEETPGR